LLLTLRMCCQLQRRPSNTTFLSLGRNRAPQSVRHISHVWRDALRRGGVTTSAPTEEYWTMEAGRSKSQLLFYTYVTKLYKIYIITYTFVF
jgi:hypothetical protein